MHKSINFAFNQLNFSHHKKKVGTYDAEEKLEERNVTVRVMEQALVLTIAIS